MRRHIDTRLTSKSAARHRAGRDQQRCHRSSRVASSLIIPRALPSVTSDSPRRGLPNRFVNFAPEAPAARRPGCGFRCSRAHHPPPFGATAQQSHDSAPPYEHPRASRDTARATTDAAKRPHPGCVSRPRHRLGRYLTTQPGWPRRTRARGSPSGRARLTSQTPAAGMSLRPRPTRAHAPIRAAPPPIVSHAPQRPAPSGVHRDNSRATTVQHTGEMRDPRPKRQWVNALMSEPDGVVMGIAVVAMHYTGMAGVDRQARASRSGWNS